jgi:LuxR family transcriptional regulator, maltose regulon positive regulatory protein
MAEARATPAAASAAEGDLLVATKLHRPRPRPGLVVRPRLAERLDQGIEGELVLVSTPAGFGKTTLVAHWAAGTSWPVAWLSLDERDNDPARFWRHVAAALATVRPGVDERVAALLGGPQPASFQAVGTALVNQLAEAEERVVLVLDDYHLVQAPEVHASVSFLLEHLPRQLRLVLVSRADPPLPLARLRAGGQLAELREADLRFTAAEAAELLGTAAGQDLPEAAVAALAARTEGWAAGLQLAALSLRDHRDPAGFVQTFTGSHRFVLDYLTEEVLGRQPAELVGFLLETSILERLSGPLCAAVTGRDDSQALLERIERANLFLVPLDEERRWWRYHQLFADLLQARLRQQPERVPELHRAAAAWYEEHGLADDAIAHALAAGDAGWAARLIEHHLEDLILRRSERATLTRWLGALPAEVLRRRPRLRAGQAIAALLAGRLEEAERLLAEAERGLAVTDDEPYQASVGRAASILTNLPAGTAVGQAELARLRGDPEREAAFARQALARLTDEDRLLATFVPYHLAVADWMAGRLAEAEVGLAEVVAKRSAGGERHLAVVVSDAYDLGHVQQAQGKLTAALDTYQRGLELAAGPPPLPSAGMAKVGLAEVLYERGELDAALQHAVDGVALCRQLAYTPPLAAGLLILARIRHARGDRIGALAAVAEAEGVALGPQVVDRNPVAALRARLALANGEVAEAAAWVQALGLSAEDEPTYPHEREYLILARVLLATRGAERALGLLERLAALAAAQGRTASLIQVRVLQALTHAARGQEQPALSSLAEALTLAAPEGWLRVFVDEGPPLAELVRKLLAGGQRAAEDEATETVPHDFLTRLAAAFQQAGAPALPAARRGTVVVPGLVEPLSARELEVLELVAAGLPNRAIAEELVVTLDTVKSHVSRLLDKLGTTNRTQAVGRARELGLVR